MDKVKCEESSGVLGRTLGQSNYKINITWGVLRKDLRQFKEFKILDGDENIITYKISDNEFINIIRDKDKYNVLYEYASLKIKCQILKDMHEVDSFVNHLLMDNWDWRIEGNIKQFKIPGIKNNFEEEDNDE